MPDSSVVVRRDPPRAPAAAHGGRVLALHWGDVCTPWRIGTPMAALRRVGFDVREELITNPPELDDAELLVMHRPNTQRALDLLEEARSRSITTVVDVDDLYLGDGVPRAWHPEYKRWVAEARVAAGIDTPEAISRAPRNDVLEQFHACLRAADAITVSTEPLAEAYAAFNPNIQVLPNCYDDSDPLWDLPQRSRATVNIGFTGSPIHDYNLALLKGALEPILRSHPEVRILEGGWRPALLPLIDAPAEQLVELGNYSHEVFPLILHEMDIVLAPLADHPFMRCKSNIRCMTAGLVGAPVVASPVGPYATYVEHGHNGFLARSSSEWTAALEQLVSDPSVRQRMGAANRERARSYAISTNTHHWKNLYVGLLGRRHRA